MEPKMTEEERYLFDVQGFLVVEDMLSPAEVSELNSLIDEYDLWSNGGKGRYDALWENNDYYRTVGECHMWDEPFRLLIGDSRIIPYLLDLIGPHFRYDHGHVLLMQNGSAALRLHGGGTPWSPEVFYHVDNGRMYNGLIAVSYALQDAGPQDGGFVCFPGSHKARFPLPEHFRALRTAPPGLVRVSQTAGSAIIFTEALTHGSTPWRRDDERRNILYRYCPGHMAFGDALSRERRLEHGYPAGWYPVPADVPNADWTPEQIMMLEPPYSWKRPPVFAEDELRTEA
jgi:hypothetical protein